MKRICSLVALAIGLLAALASPVHAQTVTPGQCTLHAGAGTGKAIATATAASSSIEACTAKITKDGDYTVKVPVKRTTAAPPVVTPPASAWILVGPEKAEYTLPGRYKVRFGDGVKAWAIRVIEGRFDCRTTLFGDPSVGVLKRCERETSPTTEPLTAAPVAVDPPVVTPPVVVPPVVTPPTAPPVSAGKVPSETAFADRSSSGPLVARTGQVITGLRITSSDGACITIPAGVSDVTIADNEIGPCGGSEGKGVDIRPGAGSNHAVDRNYIHNVTTGVYIDRGRHPIYVRDNRFKALRGPKPRGQIAQFNTVYDNGSARSVVSGNVSYGHSEVEDHVNVYNTSNVDVDCNRFTSGSVTSKSGTAVMIADGVGSNNNRARNNVVVNVTNVGLGIAAGRGNEMTGNWVYMNRNSKLHTNVGMYVWMQGSGAAGSCSGSVVKNNRVWVLDSNGNQNPWWNNGNCGAVDLADNEWGDGALTASIFDTGHPACR